MRRGLFPLLCVALAASGSVALELAMARLPMVVGYRLNPMTEAFLDRLPSLGIDDLSP